MRGPEPVARVARDLLDGALVAERREHPRGRRLGQLRPLRDLGHADRAVRQRAEHGEGSLDGLDSGHAASAGLDFAAAFHHTAPFRIVEPGQRQVRAGQERNRVPDDYEDIDLNALSDDELVEQMHNDLYDGMKRRDRRGHEHPARARLHRDQGPRRRARRRHEDRRHRLPRRHPVRARGPARGERDEGRHGDPPAAARRDRRGAGRQGRDRDGQGRHPRHRQEPRRDDARGRRLRGRSTWASTPTPTSSSPRSRSTSRTSSG